MNANESQSKVYTITQRKKMLVKIFENNSNAPWVTLTWDEFRVWIADFSESAIETLKDCRIEIVTE